MATLPPESHPDGPGMQRLFVYAGLKVPSKPDNAEVNGMLRCKPSDGDGAARFGGIMPIHGQVHYHTGHELDQIDNLESKNGYARVHVVLRDGRQAWAYRYRGDDWASMPKVPGGRWLPAMKKGITVRKRKQKQKRVDNSAAAHLAVNRKGIVMDFGKGRGAANEVGLGPSNRAVSSRGHAMATKMGPVVTNSKGGKYQGGSTKEVGLGPSSKVVNSKGHPMSTKMGPTAKMAPGNGRVMSGKVKEVGLGPSNRGVARGNSPMKPGMARKISGKVGKAEYDYDMGKGGAGSRGGKISGYTQSGKPIYEATGNGRADHYKHVSPTNQRGAKTEAQQARSVHTRYKKLGYTQQDHADAAAHHSKGSAMMRDASFGNGGTEAHAHHMDLHAAAEAHRGARMIQMGNDDPKPAYNRNGTLKKMGKSVSCPECEAPISREFALKSLASLAKGTGSTLTGSMAEMVKGSGITSLVCPSCVANVSPNYMIKSVSMLARSEGYDIQPALEGMFKSAGEGSHGGHVIGHTKSGKAVYSAASGHAAYKKPPKSFAEHRQWNDSHFSDFTAQDHKDAAMMHRAHGSKDSVKDYPRWQISAHQDATQLADHKHAHKSLFPVSTVPPAFGTVDRERDLMLANAIRQNGGFLGQAAAPAHVQMHQARSMMDAIGETDVLGESRD